MAPAQRLDDRAGLAVGKIEAIVAGERVGLQDAGPACQMSFGMFARSIARGVEQGGRRIGPAERAVVADIHPNPARLGPALGEDGNRRVVAVQPLGRKHMGLDQRMQRPQRRGAGAHLVGERRQAQVDPFAGVALALTVQRLMLAELLEQDHRQKTRAGEAARRDMERRWRLGDRLALPAGEALAHRLDHLPPAGHDFERLGHVLAELRQLRRTAARAALRRGDHDPLARQMLRERLSDRPLALEGFDGGRERGALSRQLVLGRVGLRVLQLHFQLVEQSLLAFRAHAIERATQLFDLQPQPRDQRVGAGGGRLGVSSGRFPPAPRAPRSPSAQPSRRGSAHARR